VFAAVEGSAPAERLERMKHKLATTLLVVTALILSTFAALSGTKQAKAASPNQAPGTRWPINSYGPRDSDNVILKWDEKLLQAIRLHGPQTGPTVTARAIGVLHTATYDAWAAYDPVAVPTMANGNARQADRSLANKNEAISYAAYRVLLDLFPAARYPKIGQVDLPGFMASLGYANDGSTPTPAAMVGARAADAVIAYRHHDGANQLGDEPTRTTVDLSKAYSDYTGYTPPNPHWDHLDIPWRWQVLCVLTATGVQNGMPPIPPAGNNCDAPNYTVQKPLTPQWKNVTSFALTSPTMFVPPGPPKLADGSYDPTDIDTALSDTSNLSDTKKMMAEYWADGPGTEFPPGHWAVIAQALSRKRGDSLDTDAKMFFVLGNALLDAGISAWSAKYDPANNFWRPICAIRERYKDKLVTSWLGPYKGYGKVLGQNWLPYQAPTVVTPAFPEYTSGHSTFSAAGRIAIIAFFGTDNFNAQVTIPAGSSTFEPHDATHVGTPAKDVVLSWKNLLDASDQAGWSRRYGGIHFYSGDMHGRANGASVGYTDYDKATKYFQGTATPITPPTTP
jgi:hypothetical protein